MKIEKKALKALRKMPRNEAAKFQDAFKKIEARDTKGLDIKKLAGEGYYSVRVGNYRALYVFDKELIVFAAGHRKDIYR